MKANLFFQIAGLGELLWDDYGDERFIGGSPANFAVHVAYSGHAAVLLSRVGEDQDGTEILEKLTELGLKECLP